MRLFLAGFLLLIPLSCFAETTSVILDPIIVEKGYAHEGTFFPKKLFSALPADSMEAVADYAASVEVRKRASFGIQQDISIRGSIFEDTGVSLNGIKLNDPQTGHFSMDIPLTSADIESLNIEKNALSVQYTAHPSAENKVLLTNAFGSAAYRDNLLSCSFGTAAFRNRFSFQHERSAGLRPETDFEKYTATFSSFYTSDIVDMELIEGYLKKDFGADGFYAAPVYIKEEEHIEKNFLSLRTLVKNDISFELTPYLILNRDKFVLDRDNPSFSTNIHTTTVSGIMNKIRFPNGTFLEFSMREEKIDSTNLLKHSRSLSTASVGTEGISLGNFSLKGSGGITYYSGSGRWPLAEQFSGELKYRLTPSLEPYFLYTTHYRLPSFTELYYQSPSNNGNASLDIQRSDNFEWGMRHRKDLYFVSAAVFVRNQKDTIDWVRDATASPWQAENIGNLQARGIDCAYSFKLPSSKQEFSFNYTFLHLDKGNPYQFSKYVFNYLRHKAVFLYRLPRQKYTITPVLVYEKPQSNALSGRWLGNIKIEYTPHRHCTYFAEVDNLFNTGYEEFDFIKAAGRFWKTGMTVEF